MMNKYGGLDEMAMRITMLIIRGRDDLAQILRRRLLSRIHRRMQKYPNDSELWDLLGDTYVRPSDALRAFTNALNIDPKSTSAMLGIADAHYSLGNFKDAAAHAKAAAELSKGDTQTSAIETLKNALEELGLPDTTDEIKRVDEPEFDTPFSFDEFLVLDPLEIEEAAQTGVAPILDKKSIAYRMTHQEDTRHPRVPQRSHPQRCQ